MQVRDLIIKLSKLPEDLQVFVESYERDGDFSSEFEVKVEHLTDAMGTTPYVMLAPVSFAEEPMAKQDEVLDKLLSLCTKLGVSISGATVYDADGYTMMINVNAGPHGAMGSDGPTFDPS